MIEKNKKIEHFGISRRNVSVKVIVLQVLDGRFL